MNLDAVLAQLAENPALPCDLAELALHLARDEYPRLDVEAYMSELNGMALEAQHYVRGDFPARVRGLCRYLFHEMGFRGNQQQYYDPRNSYLNQVLDRRTGIPITLSAVAMAVGRRAGLLVLGVALPGHFIAKAFEGDQEILFDPFHGGRFLSPEECEILVEKATGVSFRATPEALGDVPLSDIVARMLNNLKAIYLREGDFGRAVRVLERIRQLNPDDWLQWRDLGVALLHAGQPGKAVGPLASYLECFPNGDDAEAVRKLLDRARAEVAKWN